MSNVTIHKVLSEHEGRTHMKSLTNYGMGTNELVSCSSKANDTLHKSLEIHLEKSKHILSDYICEEKYHLKSLHSLLDYIHKQYIYFICTIQVMYIYINTIQFSMQIKVYGDQAKQIKKGQTFTARVGSVEGATVVVLESNA